MLFLSVRDTQPITTTSNNMPSSDLKKTMSFDAASISTDSIMSEKERAQKQEKKPSLLKKAVTAIKNWEPPEPRIPEGRRNVMPGWAR